MDLIKGRTPGINEDEESPLEETPADEGEAEVSGAALEEETAEEVTTKEAKPQVIAAEEQEIIDDLARMYLRDIGRVPLLTAAEEKELSSKIEQRNHLRKIEDAHFKKHRKFPSAVDIVVDLISQLSRAYPIMEVVKEHCGIENSCSLAETSTNPKFRAAIDNELALELVTAIAQKTSKETAAAEEAIINLSLNSRLLPPQSLVLIGDKTSGQEIKALLASNKFLSQLHSYNEQFKTHFIGVFALRQRNNLYLSIKNIFVFY